MQESEFDRDFKTYAYRLAEECVSDIPLKDWAIGQGAEYPWLANATGLDKAEVEGAPLAR